MTKPIPNLNIWSQAKILKPLQGLDSRLEQLNQTWLDQSNDPSQDKLKHLEQDPDPRLEPWVKA